MMMLEVPKLTFEEYCAMCWQHDWTFEESSDQRVWRKGRVERAAMRMAQPIYDKVGLIWNKFAPQDQKLRFGACPKCHCLSFPGWKCPTCNSPAKPEKGSPP